MSLVDAYKEIVKFLNSGGYNYIVIGGIAASTIGEPRITADVDVDIVINKEDVPHFLNKAIKAGFKVPVKKCINRQSEWVYFKYPLATITSILLLPQLI